jgi:hypothetical protein
MDIHSEGVATFHQGICLAIYEGEIRGKEMLLTLIEGNDVLPLIQAREEE